MPDTPLTRLQRIIRLAYDMRDDEEAQLARSIYDQRARAWVEQVREEAAKVGIRRAIPFPSGADADALRRASIEDAHSIRATYQRDLEREIARLYEANPRGNRQYYISNIERWHAQRAQWKDRQIALYNQKTAAFWAQQAFTMRNRIREPHYLFGGPAPVCEDCQAQFAAGEVDQAHVDANPTPLHPNCPHAWNITRFKLGVPREQAWVGGPWAEAAELERAA
jgi:hypothetical protein